MMRQYSVPATQVRATAAVATTTGSTPTALSLIGPASISKRGWDRRSDLRCENLRGLPAYVLATPPRRGPRFLVVASRHLGNAMFVSAY